MKYTIRGITDASNQPDRFLIVECNDQMREIRTLANSYEERDANLIAKALNRYESTKQFIADVRSADAFRKNCGEQKGIVCSEALEYADTWEEEDRL